MKKYEKLVTLEFVKILNFVLKVTNTAFIKKKWKDNEEKNQKEKIEFEIGRFII